MYNKVRSITNDISRQRINGTGTLIRKREDGSIGDGA